MEQQRLWEGDNTAVSPGLEHPGHKGRSDPRLDHPGKRSPASNIQGCHGKANEETKETNTALSRAWIGASRAHGQKQPRIRSSTEAEPRTGSSRAAMKKQRR